MGGAGEGRAGGGGKGSVRRGQVGGAGEGGAVGGKGEGKGKGKGKGRKGVREVWRLAHEMAGADSEGEGELEGSEDEDMDRAGAGGRGRWEDVVTVAIVPGRDKGNATDEDSDREEDPVASGSHLPATIQAGVAGVSRRRETGTGARARARLGEEDSQEEENLDS